MVSVQHQSSANAFCERAAHAIDQGDPAAAAAHCRAALAVEPDHAHALHLLGYLETISGRAQHGAEHLRRAVGLDPRQPVAWLNLAAAELELNRLEAASDSCEQCLQLVPEDGHAHYLRGQIAERSGALEAAHRAYRRAVALGAGVDCQFALGALCLSLCRHEEAREVFESIVRRDCDHVDALTNLGVALLELNLPHEALTPLRRATELRERMPIAHNSLANALRRVGRLEEALGHYRRALELSPGLPTAEYNLALALMEHGQPAEALSHLESAARVQPERPLLLGGLWHARQLIADWRESLTQRVIESVSGSDAALIEPFTFLTVSDSPALQLRCARAFAGLHGLANAARPRPAPAATAPLRVAYISADFRLHPIAYQLAGVFEAHDRTRIEAHAFALRTEPSPITTRIRRAFGERFHEVGELDNEAIAERCRELDVAIAVDLGGYTQWSRPGIFARRPAPLQINYLGFPGTLGAAHMDYLIADDYVVPEALRACYSEKILTLPICFQGNDRKADLPVPTLSRAQLALPEDAIIYCSFNSPLKLTARLFELWLQILAQLPNAWLWVLADNDTGRENLRAHAARCGADTSRLLFAAREPYPYHLARLALADVFLDTFPFNGGSTTSDALWAGVPVVSLSGEAFAARMSGSLLRAIGTPELIAPDLDQYRATALELGRNAAWRAQLRRQLTVSPERERLYDPQRFCAALEAAYAAIWQRYCRGEPADHITL